MLLGDEITIFMCACTNYGMLHQIRADSEKDIYFSLGMQKIHSKLRSRQDISHYQQTQSKKVIFIL